jgi:CheY-like chemotaxis protein
LLIQTLNKNEILVEVPNLESTNKKDLIRVLHVDDDPFVMEISKQILMEMGSFEIKNACCVDEAFTKLAAQNYNVVISDYDMPLKDGLQFLKELQERNIEVAFVLFTGKGREEVAIRALNLGADAYINKQGSPEVVYGELYHAIVKATERMRTRKLLVESQILMDSIINCTKDMIWSVDAEDFSILMFNKALSDYFLKTQNLVLRVGMSLEEIMPSKQLAEKWFALNRRALQEGSFSIEYTTLKDPKVLDLTFNVLRHDEKPFGISVFAKDITETRKTQANNNENEGKKA